MDLRTQAPNNLEIGQTDRLLYGADPTARMVAVEPHAGDQMRCYVRDTDGKLFHTTEQFSPWLISTRPEPWHAFGPGVTTERLAGDHPLSVRVHFSRWSTFVAASRAARETGEQTYSLRSPVEQYLMDSGRTLFKGMVFGDLVRMQLDLETTSLDPSDPDAQILIVALRTSRGEEHLLTLESSEAELLERLSALIIEIDPDVIEGHNIFTFDLPFIIARAAKSGTSLPWGRNGSPMRAGDGTQRVKVGALSLPFTPIFINGRHIIDTYQQIQRYDVGGRLNGYGLKHVVNQLGLVRADREFVRGDQISEVWKTDRERLVRYALDDVRDVDNLSRLTLPTEFYQAQLVPRGFQSIATGGPGEKINALMVRAFLSQAQSLPRPQPARDYPGGHAELAHIGVFRPVVKCDIESLYPSIMLAEGITSATDTLGAYLPMLADLTRRRLEAKRASRTAAGEERQVWEGLQSSFKVLINSFYGYLGYSGGLFNDFGAAERVTLRGQTLIRTVVAALKETGALPIEVDTDGVYFVPPKEVSTLDDEERYIELLGSCLPPWINLLHDGHYAAMLSLRLKNYALLDDAGGLTMRGSALRSRRIEPCFREFLVHAARQFLADQRSAVRDEYFALAARIRNRELPVEAFGQWSMINETTLAKQPRLSRLVRRQGLEVRSGDRLALYEREDGELNSTDTYAMDENVSYLLKRLYEVAGRFRGLFATDVEFESFFPTISMRTDLEAAHQQTPVEQLGLFG